MHRRDRLSSNLGNRPQAMHRHHHPRPISFPPLKTDLSFPQSLNLWSLIFFFLFLLWWCGWWCFGGFCVVWLVGFVWIVVDFLWVLVYGWWWIFWYKICLEVEKMWKICRKIAFSKCYQTLEIVFQTIFHCTPKCLDFNFLTGIQFPLHSFYTWNSIYIEPNAASNAMPTNFYSSLHLSILSHAYEFLFFSSFFPPPLFFCQ